MALDKFTIDNNLLLLSEIDNTQDAVGIGIQVGGDGVGYHSGIVICFQERIFFFHWDGQDVSLDEMDEFPDDLFYKELTIFDKTKVEYIKAYCEILKDEAKPKFGYVFSNGFYNADGKYYSNEGIPDITTCVGFCINAIRGILYNHDFYIALEDWDNSTLPEVHARFMQTVSHQIATLTEVDPKRLEEITNGTFKRVTPSELTSSAFYGELPIRKKSIDSVNPFVEQILTLKHYR